MFIIKLSISLKVIKKCICTAAVFFLMPCVAGCGVKKENKEQVAETARLEQNSESGTIPESQPLPLIDVMYSIADSQGLDGAVDYESGMQDGQKDALVFLCRSESGKYEAYGFISTEYGKNGLLINNVINDQDNWNFFEESWSCGDTLPEFEENGDYEVIFTFTQGEEGEYKERSIHFDTYDTGTMSIEGESPSSTPDR